MRRTLRLALVLFATFATTTPLSAASCVPITTNPPPHVNMQRVRSVWLSWYNRLRLRMHLTPYVLSDHLNGTAMNWSAFAVKRGTIDHKRYPGSPYYDYAAIEDWFRNKGLEFANVDGKTFTENIGWGTYDCSKRDCTEAMIDAIRTTFGFFLSERGKSYSPHYNSIVNPEFRKIGLGIAVSPTQGRYYLTVHFATAITSDPPAYCAE